MVNPIHLTLSSGPNRRTRERTSQLMKITTTSAQIVHWNYFSHRAHLIPGTPLHGIATEQSESSPFDDWEPSPFRGVQSDGAGLLSHHHLPPEHQRYSSAVTRPPFSATAAQHAFCPLICGLASATQANTNGFRISG